MKDILSIDMISDSYIIRIVKPILFHLKDPLLINELLWYWEPRKRPQLAVASNRGLMIVIEV
jgi:hypothetical protein